MKNERLIELRKKAGLTQTELAKEIGLSQSMITYIENGGKDTSTKYKVKLAQFFGVSVEYLFFEVLYN